MSIGKTITRVTICHVRIQGVPIAFMIFFRSVFNLSALSACQRSTICQKASKNQLLCVCAASVLLVSVSFLFSLTCTLIAASQAKLQEPAD